MASRNPTVWPQSSAYSLTGYPVSAHQARYAVSIISAAKYPAMMRTASSPAIPKSSPAATRLQLGGEHAMGATVFGGDQHTRLHCGAARALELSQCVLGVMLNWCPSWT
jgi:hypothetical protein